jgi:hypothetical protein
MSGVAALDMVGGGLVCAGVGVWGKCGSVEHAWVPAVCGGAGWALACRVAAVARTLVLGHFEHGSGCVQPRSRGIQHGVQSCGSIATQHSHA